MNRKRWMPPDVEVIGFGIADVDCLISSDSGDGKEIDLDEE